MFLHRLKKIGWFLIVAVGVVVWGILIKMENVGAANMANFQAGYIISDYQMMNYNSMSEGEIQQFLSARNGCGNRDYNYYLQLSKNSKYRWHFKDGHFVCLSEERFGEGEVIGVGETAAHIIWQAAQDYRINPRVLIVSLQKETGLITDPIPNNADYRKAMGYGCPDSGSCSVKYYGFKNQVRRAAELFKTVMNGGWSNYPVGNNYIQYSPNVACGGSVVNVRNKATSALYRYTPYQPNAAALASGYGTAHCGAYGNRNFYNYFEDWFGGITSEGRPSLGEILTRNRVARVETDLDVEYQTHVAEYGWLPTVKNGDMAGTAGYNLRMEAFALALSQEKGVEYRSHVQGVGWESLYKHDGEISGTMGKSKRIEAVQIRLTGEMAKLYDVYYRVHVQDMGWTAWVKNDQIAGTTGKKLRVEAMQIYLKKKDLGSGPIYRTHVQKNGWVEWVNGGKISGTMDQARRIEAVQIKLPEGLVAGDVNYRTHVQGSGWGIWKKNGEISGTVGKSLRVEAIEIKLSGKLAQQYNVYYRVYTQDVGWMKWVKNGEMTGTTGKGLRMEALQIELVKK